MIDRQAAGVSVDINVAAIKVSLTVSYTYPACPRNCGQAQRPFTVKGDLEASAGAKVLHDARSWVRIEHWTGSNRQEHAEL